MMRIPTATYRLQFHKDFGFAQARELVDYLRALGITDLYASPIFKARAGSLHGYDVVDPNQINPELGSIEEFSALAEELRRRDMGWLQDFVPNHMAYDSENRILMDVLENGPNSTFANFFDIEWNHPVESMRGKILAPCLGQFYGQCLENGELILRYDAQGLAVHYYQQRFPINVECYAQVLAPSVRELRRKLGRGHPDVIKLLGVLYALKNLPSGEDSQERADQIIFAKSLLWELYTTDKEIKAFFDENVARFNGRPGDPESFNRLDQLLGQQFYRLSFWKVATEEINYRRFFNINELISLRIEDPRVFDATHAFLFNLIDEGKITGLRVDHIDGLYDPAGYLQRIHDRVGDFYVAVEKILHFTERLPENWAVCGTTGYDFTNYVNEVFCLNRHERKLSELYARFTGFRTPYEDLVSEKKRLIIGKHMAGDVDRLANLLKRVSSRDRFGGDITLYGLKRALVEVLTFFPVYRSYVSVEAYRNEDRLNIREAMGKAKEANPALLYELEFIGKFLLLEHDNPLPEEEKHQWIHFIMRLQQLTGPLMAKGFEDTTLYIYNRLISLNEVGGDPGRFGCSPETFHEFNRERARQWPQTMNATSTHDSKRGEDVRARINVLSEIPDEWEEQVLQWSRMNRRHKYLLKGKEVPDRNDEYFLYQSLIGAWPFTEDQYPSFRDRLKGYMIKAVREAKVHTEWLKPDLAYEEAFVSFIEKILEASESNAFLHALVPFVHEVSHFGALNSLSQTLLKIGSPGLPDFYQGTELWDLNFVDPDNRRFVDFCRRRQLLDEIRQQEMKNLPALIREILSDWSSGKAKLFVTHKALSFRRLQTKLFRTGSYIPMRGSGKKTGHLCAFGRRAGDDWALVLVPRYVTRLCEPREVPVGESCWGETALVLPKEAPESWLQLFTGESITALNSGTRRLLPLREVFGTFPVALLAPDGSST